MGIMNQIGVQFVIAECPSDPDETAERLYMGRLDRAHAEAFLTHMKVCARCRRIYQINVAFVDAMRGAARLLLRKDAVES